MNEKERKSLMLSKIILLSVGIVAIILVVWFAWSRPGARTESITSFEECVDAGNPVLESYPEVCVTKSGKRFANPAQATVKQPQRLVIQEWGVAAEMSIAHDAYYTHNPQDNTVTVSTHTLDNRVAQITGCRSGLKPLVFERAKPGDVNAEGVPWEEAELKERGVKVGEYYYFEKQSIDTLCIPDASDEHVKAVQAIQAQIRDAFRSLQKQ